MTENQTIKDRLILYIKHLKLSVRKFEENCDLANGYIKNTKRAISTAHPKMRILQKRGQRRTLNS